MTKPFLLSAALCATLGIVACGQDSRDAELESTATGEGGASSRLAPADLPLTGDALTFALRFSPVPPIPDDPTNRFADDESAAELGRHLFHSRALSKAGDVSCATCHDHRNGFIDGLRLAEGVLPLERHTPSLWNVAHLRWFFWDGRSDSLWAQALVPIEDPLEHAFTRVGVARAISADPELRRRYEDVFGALPDVEDQDRFPAAARPVPENDRAHQLAAEHAREGLESGEDPKAHHSHLYGSGFYHPHQRAWDGMAPEDQEAATRVFVNVGKALAAFQRRIVSTRAPFDVFVEGLREGNPEKLAALDDSAVRGFELFVGKAQCNVCHHGPLFTDYEFHDTRIPAAEGAPVDDPGRTRGIEALRASEFGVASRWSDDPDGPARAKVDYLPTHVHGGSFEFKTPSLRNVELTAPYMHNGGIATLEEVIDFYATREGERTFGGQAEQILRPLDLSKEERTDLVNFLRSLTDDSLELDAVRPPR